jgi:hypothetical protein
VYIVIENEEQIMNMLPTIEYERWRQSNWLIVCMCVCVCCDLDVALSQQILVVCASPLHSDATLFSQLPHKAAFRDQSFCLLTSV